MTENQRTAVRKLANTGITGTIEQVLLIGLLAGLIPAAAMAGQTMSHSLDEIAATAVAWAESEAASRQLQVSRLEAGRLDPRLALTHCENPLEAFSPYGGRLTHRTTVGVRCNGSKPWTVYVPVTITTETTVVTLRQPLARGTIVTASDVLLTRMTGLRPEQPYIGEIDQVIGRELTRPMAKGTPLLPAMLRNPAILEKGDTAPLVVIAGNLTVRSTGEALQQGAVGDTILLENRRSGQTVEGEVQADGSVLIRRGY